MRLRGCVLGSAGPDTSQHLAGRNMLEADTCGLRPGRLTARSRRLADSPPATAGDLVELFVGQLDSVGREPHGRAQSELVDHLKWQWQQPGGDIGRRRLRRQRVTRGDRSLVRGAAIGRVVDLQQKAGVMGVRL